MSDPLKRQQTDRRLANALTAFNLLRTLDREIPGQLVSAFLYVASHNPCHKQAMEEDLDITASSGSRLVDWLSSYHRLGKPGLGLVVKERDPFNHKRLIVKLTPKGQELAHQMKSLIFS